jgi:eukaryotic-like serine/threonine-protein kinase
LHAPSSTQPDRSEGLRYQRLLALGSGGMANVHLSLALGQGGFRRLVVVKSVREELLGDPTMRQMFLAEARISARLNHPNVVQISEVVETTDGVMLVMEYLDGLPFSAAARTATDQLSLAMRLRVVCDVLAGLGYAHDLTDYQGKPLGLVHRDVSAQNILLTFDGRVKLLDFGIAKLTSLPDKTRTGVIKGRIAYMPVEQVTGKPVDRRTDLYAVGCLLWEVAARRRMWEGLSEPQIVHNVVKGKLPELSACAEVDADLESIVRKATAYLPVDRYQTADELRLALEQYLSRFPTVSARDIGALLSQVCAEVRTETKRKIAEAVAAAEREQPPSSGDGDPTQPTGFKSGTRPVGWAPISNGPVRSMSPTPGPYLLPPAAAASQDSESGALHDASRSSTISAALRPRRTGVWLMLALAGALAVAAWLPSVIGKLGAPVTHAPLTAAASPATLPMAPPPPSPQVTASAVTSSGSPVQQAEAAVPPASSASPSSKSPRVRPRVGAPVARPAATSAAARGRTGCDPPYYFSGGIKTYKPECI